MKTQKPTIAAFATPPGSGKVIRNEVGDAFWEFRLEDGSYSGDVDTQRALRILNNNTIQLDNTNFAADPYNNSGITPTAERPRRSLDDLRKLSQEIVNTKVYKRPAR